MNDSEMMGNSFSGHETFAFRYSWLKKGVDALQADPAIFSDPYAIVKLGVGKNMVQSIRHWCLTTRLIEPLAEQDGFKVTDLGMRLFGPEGADPYLEDTGTLWLLHWLLASNEQRATTWRWAFGFWNQTEFSKEQMLTDLKTVIARQRNSRVTDTSLMRDIETFLHTYVPTRASRGGSAEDTISCPLVELHLLRENPVNNHYEFIRGRKPTLPDGVVGFALLEHWERTAAERGSLSFEDIAYGLGSPGRAFKLDEDSLLERLERIETLSSKALLFDQTSGLRQVLRRKKITPFQLLQTSFGQTERSAA